jgi:hypothetical protein
MTVSELIEELKKYPPEMTVAIFNFPQDPVEIHIRRYESEHITDGSVDFDYVSLE